jgi:hypothetical protein
MSTIASCELILLLGNRTASHMFIISDFNRRKEITKSSFIHFVSIIDIMIFSTVFSRADLRGCDTIRMPHLSSASI